MEFIIILKLKDSGGTAMASPSYHQQKVKAQSIPGPCYKKFDYIYETHGGT